MVMIKDVAIRSAFKYLSVEFDLNHGTSVSLTDIRRIGKVKTACMVLLLPEDKLTCNVTLDKLTNSFAGQK